MKLIKYILFTTFLQLCFASCKKDVVTQQSVSAVTVVNAIVGSNLIADFSGVRPYVYYNTTPQIGFGSSQEYPIASGNVPVTVYQVSDTTHAVYKQNVNLAPQGIYNLFLSGTNPASPDVLLNADKPPYYNPADSLTGVRFINLSPGSSPVNVNIQGNANGSEVSSLAYKSLTAFKSYKATYNISSYTFEFRDSATGSLLATYTMSGINNGTGSNTSTNQWRNRNVTIVLNGSPGSQGTFEVNNY